MNNLDHFEEYIPCANLEQSYVFPYGEVRPGSTVLIYGAGAVGQAYINQLDATGYASEVIWVDSEFGKYKKILQNVCSPDAISAAAERIDFAVIAVAGMRAAQQIYKIIRAHGISEEKIIWPLSYIDIKRPIEEERLLYPAISEEKEIFQFWGGGRDLLEQKITEIKKIFCSGGLVIPNLVVSLTSSCTLKCRNCNNLMSYFSNFREDNVNTISEQLRRIMDCVDYIPNVSLIGGEPFLYRNIGEIVELLDGMKQVGSIVIASNGTLIPPEETLEILKNSNKVHIQLSDYPSAVDNTEFVKTMEQYQIPLYVMREMVWIDPGKPESHGISKEAIARRYHECGSGYMCTTLLHGKLFQCARSSSLYELGIITDSCGYLDVMGSNNLRNDLRNFYLDTYNPACDYCTLTDRWRGIPAGEQPEGKFKIVSVHI